MNRRAVLRGSIASLLTLLAATLVGIVAAQDTATPTKSLLAVEAQRAALHHGDYGPDRPIALLLTPLGLDDDPLSSVTEDEAWTFERLTGSDLFAYLFAGEGIDRPETAGLDGRALACGEVGVGANR